MGWLLKYRPLFPFITPSAPSLAPSIALCRKIAMGTKSWSLTTKLPLRDRQGRIVGTCGISREISEMKEMEEQLETERNLLRAVIDNLPDLIFLKDIEGRYLLNNMAHVRWLGGSHAFSMTLFTGITGVSGPCRGRHRTVFPRCHEDGQLPRPELRVVPRR